MRRVMAGPVNGKREMSKPDTIDLKKGPANMALFEIIFAILTFPIYLVGVVFAFIVELLFGVPTGLI
jgi:hypothetical protein